MEKSTDKKKEIKIIPLIFYVGLPLLIGFIIQRTMPNMSILYSKLAKPIFAVPKEAFPVAWTVLYILMGAAAYMVYIKGYKNKTDVSSALFVYYIQIILNFLWSFIFFGLRLYGISFIELTILLLFVVLTIIRFYKKAGKKPALLMIPYLLWITYADVLNFYIWMLNEM